MRGVIRKTLIGALALVMALTCMLPFTAQSVPAEKTTPFERVAAANSQSTSLFKNGARAVRSGGATRYQTAINTAQNLKAALGVDKFQSIIVAASHNFPDALAGSYLAARKSTPIIIVRTGIKTPGLDEAAAFINENLDAGGTVYILGGTSAVSEAAEKRLAQIGGITVKRIAGTDRYGTNIEILKEAGIDDGEELLVADARNFADALSASALGKPILLVDKKKGALTAEQKEFLSGKSFSNICILGGKAAVPESVANELANVFPGVSIERIAGSNRYETSVRIARRFFQNPGSVVFATGTDFPDGLTGGPLSYVLRGPLVLTRNRKAEIKTTAEYTQEAAPDDYLILGGETAISEDTVKTIAGDEPNEAVSFTFDRAYRDGCETGFLFAFDKDGDLQWQYTTNSYQATELSRTNDIGATSSGYLIAEDGNVICLDKKNGAILWQNDTQVGASTCSCFDADESLYICGYYGPELTKITKDGNATYQISNIQGYIWPSEISLTGDGLLQIKMTSEKDYIEVYILIDPATGGEVGVAPVG